MNRKRREAIGNMFLDVAKYLITSTAISSFVVEKINLTAFAVSVTFSAGIIAMAYFIIPQDKEDK